MFKLVSKLRTPTYKWQGQGGSTTLTKQNRVAMAAREEQQTLGKHILGKSVKGAVAREE